MMSKTKKHSLKGGHAKAGFTLTEVMVAAVLLMLFIGGFSTSFIMAIRTLNVSNNHYRAAAIARNRIQRARSFDYDSLTLMNEESTRIDRYGNIDPNGVFRRWTRIGTNTVTAPYTVRIQVGVQYPVRTGDYLSEPLVVDNLIAVRM